jgi:hypothetical protein
MNNTKFQVEHDVEYPKNFRRGPPCKYPWDELEVGDSFFVSTSDLPPSGISTMRNVCSQVGRRRGKLFSCVAQPDGVRIWYRGPRGKA